MSLWAIVPVKPLRRGKSRLSGVLSEEERTLLNYTMLANTMRALRGVPEIDQVLVISRDPGALSLAREFGARTVQEDGHSDLNIALKRATVVAQMHGAHSVFVVPADLPLLTPPAVQEMIHAANKPPVVVIAPDRHLEGTNGLLISPVGLVDYKFGLNSFSRHTEQARRYNVRVEVWQQPAFQLDLDLPEDLEFFQRMEAVEYEEQGRNEP